MAGRTMEGVAAAALTAALAAVVALGAAGCSMGGPSSAGKPSKEEFRDVMMSNLEKRGGAAEDAADLVDCVVDTSYDRLSAKTLRAIVDGDERQELAEGEGAVMSAATVECVGDPIAELRESFGSSPDVPDVE